MATAAKFRADVAIHDLPMKSSQMRLSPTAAKGPALPKFLFPRLEER